ncbi:uncharacterized protein DEA37_0005310 [Paragonimus westermani]|uniref:Uncharacterized protein n=1 Tax=Paragonimus westermani TaxID=34504 RepID=A0A5J4NY00_9TREM|nr:uncharacterized protein DEA37_0005310 [Paragonimus westermani]
MNEHSAKLSERVVTILGLAATNSQTNESQPHSPFPTESVEQAFTHIPDQNLRNSEEQEELNEHPSSPLSVQQGGGASVLRSPPFSRDNLLPELSDSDVDAACMKDHTLADISDVYSDSEVPNLIHPCATTVWVTDPYVEGGEAGDRTQSSVVIMEKSGDACQSSTVQNESTVACVMEQPNMCGDCPDGPPVSSQTRPVRKSVLELYGQPSWWGDGDDNYSYPHTSLLTPKESGFPMKETGKPTDVHSVPSVNCLHPKIQYRFSFGVLSDRFILVLQVTDDLQTNKRPSTGDSTIRPRAEAFIIEFASPSKTPGDHHKPSSTSGSLSQCVPERIKRGFDERERQKKDREQKREELRRQSVQPTPNRMSIASKLLRTNSQPTTIRASTNSAKVAGTTRPTTASIRNALQSTRTIQSAGTTRARPTTTAPLRSTTRSLVPRCAPDSAQVTSAARRALAATNSSSAGTRKSSVRGAASLTPSLSGATPGQRSGVPRVSTTRSGLSARGAVVTCSPTGRKSSIPITSCVTTTATTVKTTAAVIRTTQRRSSGCTLTSVNSQRTAPSALDMTKISSTVKTKGATTKYGLAISKVVSPSVTGTITSKSNIRPNVATLTKSGTQNVSRSFMSATASSGAKRVSITETGTVQNTVRDWCGPPPGNSAKRPVTSTHLRRPPNTTRVSVFGVSRPTADPADTGACGAGQFEGPSVTQNSELAATVIATMNAYNDPKEYLFYRMFQGAQSEGATPDDVFKTFVSQSPPQFPSSDMKVDREQFDLLLPSHEGQLANGTDLQNLVNDTHKTTAKIERSSHGQPIVTNTEMIPTSSSGVSSIHKVATLLKQPTEHDLSNGRPSQPIRPGSISAATVISQPDASSKSPVQASKHTIADRFAWPQATTNESLSTSMFVSTSVTSLAPSQTGTYIIENDDRLSNGNAPISTGGLEPDSLTPRGSLNDLVEIHEKPQTTGTEVGPQSILSTSPPSWTKAKRPDQRTASSVHATDPQSPIRSGDLHTAQLGLKHLQITKHRTWRSKPRKENKDADLRAATPTRDRFAPSTSAWVETCRDDLAVDRTEAPGVTSGALDDSMLVSASVTSLAPSCAGTYVLDVDETLAAQGFPPVVVESREDLLSPTDNHMLLPQTFRTKAPMHTFEALTPRASPLNSHLLWDVTETEDCTEDVVLLKSIGRLPDSQISTLANEGQTKAANADDESTRVTDEGEETYKSLPNPFQTRAPTIPDPTIVELPVRTSETSTVDNRVVVSELGDSEASAGHITHSGKQASSSIRVLAGVGVSDQTDTKACKVDLQPFIASSATAVTNQSSARLSGASVGLPRPERSPSSSISSSATYGSSASARVRVNSATFDEQFSVNPHASVDTPVIYHANQMSTYAPLTDIHNCYRALQQSVNYLIQSQNEPFTNTEASHAFALVNSVQTSTLPTVSVHQQPSDIAFQTHCSMSANNRLTSPAAAIWPSDTLTDSLRNALTRRHRHNRRHQSTASLDSALHDTSDHVATGTQIARVPAVRPTSLRKGSPSVLERGPSIHSAAYTYYSNGDHRSHHDDKAVVNPEAVNRPYTRSFSLSAWDEPNVLVQCGSNDEMQGNNERMDTAGAQTVIDSRTFTRRKNTYTIPATTLHTPALHSSTYEAWVASMSAISRGIDTLAQTPLFQTMDVNPNVRATTVTNSEKDSASKLAADHRIDRRNQPNSELPDSTTGPSSTEPIRSAFVTPLPQRSIGGVQWSNHSGGSRQTQDAMKRSSESEYNRTETSAPISSDTGFGDSNETTMQYTLMVDSIRQLSLKLRHCSEKLIQRVRMTVAISTLAYSSDNPNAEMYLKGDSRPVSDGNVPTFTKYALNDALENMHTINEQLKIVDKLLFAKDPRPMSFGRFHSADRNPFTFVPIDSGTNSTDYHSDRYRLNSTKLTPDTSSTRPSYKPTMVIGPSINTPWIQSAQVLSKQPGEATLTTELRLDHRTTSTAEEEEQEYY